MQIGKVLFEKIKNRLEKKRVERHLKWLDRRYYDTFQNCFSLFPPSFYLTHTPEEVERITKEKIEQARKAIEELE